MVPSRDATRGGVGAGSEHFDLSAMAGLATEAGITPSRG